MIVRKNSFWRVNGVILIWWGFYTIMVVVKSAFLNYEIIGILFFASLIKFVLDIRNNVAVIFQEDYFEVDNYITKKRSTYNYTQIAEARVIYSRVEGFRLRIRIKLADDSITRFSILFPDNEFLTFIKTKIELKQ